MLKLLSLFLISILLLWSVNAAEPCNTFFCGCGDNVCDTDAGEDCISCPNDCGTLCAATPSPTPIPNPLLNAGCGDGLCDNTTENCTSCFADCNSTLNCSTPTDPPLGGNPDAHKAKIGVIVIGAVFGIS